MAKRVVPFLVARDQVHARLRGFDPADEARRSEFQEEIERILAESPENFYVLGEMDYLLEPLDAGRRDWRRRDINRLLSRYREDRPINDAKRWAQRAITLALIALAAALVSAVNDVPGAWENLVKLYHLV